MKVPKVGVFVSNGLKCMFVHMRKKNSSEMYSLHFAVKMYDYLFNYKGRFDSIQ